ncbi:MAG: IS66 family transposase [Verrucomicrobiae bacterium]|nr:IS66 family transposase [Verrucomicrobiae bacterium]
MGSSDALNLDEVRRHIVERLIKGEHDELVDDILKLLEKLGRRTASLEFELMRLRKSAQGRTSERIDSAQLSLLLSLVREDDKPKADDDDDKPKIDPLEAMEKFEARIDEDLVVVDPSDIEAATAEGEKSKPSRRESPPAHLRVEQRIIDVDPSQLAGCEDMVFIGYAEAHTLDWQQGHFIHVHTKRAKYAAKGGLGPVVAAPAPPQVIVRGLAEPGLLAHVIVSKYGDHLPLNRLAKIFARDGVNLTVSTMVGWIRACAELLEPLVKLLGQTVLASHLVQTDDTGVQVLDRDEPDGSKRGHLWGYLGDGKLAYFEYTPDWKADATRRFLKAREGWLQADAYAGYDAIFKAPGSRAKEVGCWAHARRYFVEAKDGGDARAAVPLAIIAKLYKVERKAKLRGLKHEARRKLRAKHSRPLLDELFKWIIEHAASEPPSSPLARAFTYALNQREALERFLEDGRLPLDNTAAERALRGIAVGRNNWQFAGNDASGKWAAIMYSLIRTCELNGVEPWAYLRDVLTRLADGWPQRRLAELLPQNWSATSAAAA